VRLGDTTPPSTAIKPAEPSSDTRKKQEFILANGERILGHVLSETPQTIYIDHGALGVLTLPRSQIASKPIEVILINGDRIVGDLIAETPECLYVKHASLGMLTVPHSQRSTRVVEAIMKDGDRILGEVLAETENFTVIRSATLGTVAVQHDQVAMLNRKIEQMQLRALPPALEDKAKSPM
jgi:RNase P/RNase MRP subunit p29